MRFFLQVTKGGGLPSAPHTSVMFSPPSAATTRAGGVVTAGSTGERIDVQTICEEQ